MEERYNPPLLLPKNEEALHRLMNEVGAKSPLDLPVLLNGKVNSRDMAHAVLGRYDLIPTPRRRRLAHLLIQTQMQQTPSVDVFNLQGINQILNAAPAPVVPPTPEEEEQATKESLLVSIPKFLYATITTLGRSVLSAGEWLLGRAIDLGLSYPFRWGAGEAVYDYLMNRPLEEIDRERILYPKGTDRRRMLDFIYYLRNISEANPVEEVIDFWKERRKGQILEDMAKGGYFISRLIEGSLGAAVSAVGTGVGTISAVLGHASAGDFEGANKRFFEDITDWVNLHASLFHKDGSEMDMGTYMLRLTSAGSALSFDRVPIVFRDNRGRIGSDEIPLLELENFKRKLKEQGAVILRVGNNKYPNGISPDEVSLSERDVLKGLFSMKLFNRTVNPIYAFGIVSELFAPFPMRFIGAGARIAKGTSSFGREAGELLHVLKYSPSLFHKTEALLDLFMLPSGVAMNLPFGVASKLMGRVGLSPIGRRIVAPLSQRLMAAGAQNAVNRLSRVMERINASLFGSYYIPYEYAVYGYNAAKHRAWDEVLSSVSRKLGLKGEEGLQVLRQEAKEYQHLLTAMPNEVIRRAAAGEYHTLVSHILEKEGLSLPKTVDELTEIRTRLLGKYGTEVSPIAAALHTAETYFGIGKTFARFNLKVGEVAQRLANGRLGRWVYPMLTFTDPYLRSSLNFSVGVSTLLQGQLQKFERTFAEMFQGIMGMPEYERSMLHNIYERMRAVKQRITERFGRGATEAGVSLHPADVGEMLHAVNRLIIEGGFLPETNIFRLLTSKGDTIMQFYEKAVSAAERMYAKQPPKLQKPELMRDLIMEFFKRQLRGHKIQFLDEELLSFVQTMMDMTPKQRELLPIALKGMEHDRDIMQYALLSHDLRRYGATPEWLEGLEQHYQATKRSVSLGREEIQKAQALFYNLLFNHLLTPDQLAEAKRFLRGYTEDERFIDLILQYFQTTRGTKDPFVDKFLRYSQQDVEEMVSVMKQARAQYAEGYRQSMLQYFPECADGV